MNKTHITWECVDGLVNDLVKQIKKSDKQYSCIYGIPRGGLIPAVMLSHRLNIPMVNVITSGCLIIDEIADKGNELSKPEYHGFDVAVLYRRYNCPIKPTYNSWVFNSDDWIVFPWET